MPEIAEVALMSNAISEILSGQKLAKISVLGGRYLVYKIKDTNGQWIGKIKNEKTGRMVSIDPKKHPNGQSFVELKNLDQFNQNQPLKVNSVNVVGKFCWIDLEQDWYIALTFGMSGGIYYEPTDDVLASYSKQTGKNITKTEYMKHFHVKFETENGSHFYFGDVRRFGTITISNQRQALKKKLNKLGSDMLTGTPITDQQFIDIFRQKKFHDKNICVVLMGQEAISGVGNYIKAEVLYACQINPWALVSDLNDQTLINLHHAIREIASNAYKGHGASLYTYTGTRREKGTFQSMLNVYNKATDPLGFNVTIIDEKYSPDKRTTHYVKEVQTIGEQRDPNMKSITTKIPIKMISEKQSEPVKPKISIKLKASCVPK